MKISRWTYPVIVFSLALVCTAVFAFDVPEGEPSQTLLEIIFNFKTMAPLALASTVVVFVVQALKKFLPSSNVAQMAADGLAVVYAVLHQLISGFSLGSALLDVLLVSGGAMFLYNKIFKHLFEKKDKAIQVPLKP